jgi:hypothetical protein
MLGDIVVAKGVVVVLEADLLVGRGDERVLVVLGLDIVDSAGGLRHVEVLTALVLLWHLVIIVIRHLWMKSCKV